MEQLLTTIPAHFDGKEIKLDVPYRLQPHTRLLITILDSQEAERMLVQASMALSESAFARVWDNDEDAVYDDL
jgi:hypothetical protein